VTSATIGETIGNNRDSSDIPEVQAGIGRELGMADFEVYRPTTAMAVWA
jgi:hypothetical protein